MTDVELVLARLAESSRLQQQLADLAPLLAKAAHVCSDAIRGGRKLILFGNGGSASDAQHLACEMVVKYRLERPAMPAIALTTDTSILTAAGNDLGFEKIFARQLEALAGAGDVAVAISTSGTSPNIVEGIGAAREVGCAIVVLTGEKGRVLADAADVGIVVPSRDADRIQECHITLGHILCDLVEEWLYGETRA